MLLNSTLLLNVALLIQSTSCAGNQSGFNLLRILSPAGWSKCQPATVTWLHWYTHPPILTHLTAASTSSSCQLPAGTKGFPNRCFYWRVDVICAIMERTSARLYKATRNKQNLGYWILWDTKPIQAQWLQGKYVQQKDICVGRFVPGKLRVQREVDSYWWPESDT